MVKSTLRNIGLTEKEINLYLLIIKHKEITAGQIAKRTKESRTHTYDTINKLLEKGLINFVIKNNVKYFQSVNPDKLLDYIKYKKIKIEKQEKEVSKIIPEIKKMQRDFKKDFVRIEVYEGEEGLKTIMNDIIREGKNFITWGATSKVNEYLPDFFIKKYLNERKRKKIKAKQLFTDFHGVLKSSLSNNKKLPKEFASPTTTVVYGNKVVNLLWLEIPRAILTKNKELADSYKKHFELMWKQAK